jgi:anti-sigma B factor antagonist
MDVQTKKFRRCTVVLAKGRIDSSTVGQLTETLVGLRRAGQSNIVLNLKDVTFMSSAGLGELVDTQNACKKLNGQLVLVTVPQRVKEALELAGLDPLFKSFEDETEAVGSF